LADIFVNDAFTNCHRNHASMTGIPKYLPSYMGMHLEKEVANLSIVFKNPPKPITLVISGAKLETKVPVIENFFSVGENILVGGLIANSLLCASGKKIGCSKFEEEHKKEAEKILSLSNEEGNASLYLPSDTLVADFASDEANMLNVASSEVPDDMIIFDIGEKTALDYAYIIENSGLIIWNGPLGKYETQSFSKGSKVIANAVNKATKNGAISLIGGGDTTDFHIRYNLPLDEYTWVSTGGGAMLEFLSGVELPALKFLI
ncbi:MAG: phosphoglycerate kinase, partial [Candidatus Peribacteraceae bacterium]|nr:phosphoglycerate kinase [Candidatus Peribacteraceae bacterium]